MLRYHGKQTAHGKQTSPPRSRRRMEANALTYLGLIEQRSTEIIRSYASLKAREQAEDAPSGAAGPVPSAFALLGAGPTVPMGQDLLHVQPPKLEEFSDDGEGDADEGDTRPLTHDELKARTIQRLRARGKRTSAPSGK